MFRSGRRLENGSKVMAINRFFMVHYRLVRHKENKILKYFVKMKKGFNFVLSIPLMRECTSSHYKAGFFCSIATGGCISYKAAACLYRAFKKRIPRASDGVDGGKPAGRFLFAEVNTIHNAYHNNSSTPEAPRQARNSYQSFEPSVRHAEAHTRTSLGSPERIQPDSGARHRRPGSSLQTVTTFQFSSFTLVGNPARV